MPSTFRIHKRTALVCLLAGIGLGIAAERYRQYLSTNVGELSVQRTDTEIALAIDGDSFTGWHRPVTLRAGAHDFHATWREFQLKTTINVKRGDKAVLNRVKYSLHNGQLQVKHNSHLVDVVPRPESEVYAIQTASGKLWHTADGGEIALQLSRGLGGAERYTIHWLRPDHSEAFIQSRDGRFVINTSSLLDESQGFLRLSDGDDWPSVFKIDRVAETESWIHFAVGRHFVDVDADPKRVRTTRYELFASAHILMKAAGESDNTKPVPPPPAIPVFQVASSAASVRRFKGHENVICAVVFTPDGRHIISGSLDGTIRFWNVQSGKQVDAIQTHRPAMSLAISSDGKSLACGMADAVVKIWKLEYDPEIAHRDERILSRAYSGDVLSIAFSPDDTKIVAGGNNRQQTRMWNLLAPDERCKSSTIMGPVTSLVWSRSAAGVLLCIRERSLCWWPKITGSPSRDARSGKLLIRSGDDPLIVVGGDILDAETHEVVHSFRQRRGVRAVSAQMSVRRNLLVTGDVIVNAIHEVRPDELVSVWDLETGRPLAVLRERFGQVGNIAIAPNGEYVAYGNGIRATAAYMKKMVTGDYDLRVWKITKEKP